MKKECIICKQSRGKRVCRLLNNEMVCSRCCVSIQKSECKECPYYKSSEKYRASKDNNSREKDFIIELNEEVEKSVNHALALMEKRHFTEGKAIIDNLMKENPGNYYVNYAMGVFYALKDQYDEAIKYLDKATDIFPNFVEAYFNKAAAYQRKLDIGNMIRAFQKVVEIGDPKDEEVKKAKDFISDTEKQIMKTEGIDLESYLMSMDYFNEAFSYLKNQNWEKGIFCFKKCLAINPKHPQSYGNIGICYAKLGQRKKALKAFDKALEIDPNYEIALVNRMVVESLKDGEKIREGKLDSIEYYREYPFQKKSYIKSVMEKMKL
jgi:tetratricopeptide (TPR) repeat protein